MELDDEEEVDSFMEDRWNCFNDDLFIESMRAQVFLDF